MPVKQEPQNVTIPTEPSATKYNKPPVAVDAERQKARGDAVKRHTEIRRAFAWPLHRVPLEKRLASTYLRKGKAKLVLPRSYRSGDGEDTKMVRSDEDLNVVVYNWYEERIEAEEEQGRKGVNYVAKDGVISRRHEYLGPDPRVAGYQVGRDGNIHVRWWDGFLEDQWVGKEKWKIEVTCDDDGEWVETVS